MKNFVPKLLLLFLVFSTITSCELIGDIFQAGMVIGIFIVVAIILLIWWIVRKMRR
ncbi:MAG: hypothetical protein ITG00_02560 [Flavobacterium sp.]|nr:hypothetical protein [Flavobacterium sp.]